MKNRLNNRRFALLSGVACAALFLSSHEAHAFNYVFDNGVDIHFDNTLQYSVLQRTAPLSQALGGPQAANTNDGDDNLRAGIVSNRIDLLTKFDINYNGFGFDTSVDSFYDSVYNQKTQNKDGDTYNPSQQPYNKFTTATQTQAGRNVELRNLFVFGTQTIGDVPVTVRVGRLVNLYGESLLFAANGISYGQAPIDIERASSVPNTQAKDVFLPVGQALISAQLTDSISASAYYQFEWEKFNFNPAGSYFSTVDLEDEGGERIYAGPGATAGSANYFYRGKDISGSNSGQFGAAIHYDPAGTPWDFGLYALQYNDSEPQVYTRLGAAVTPQLAAVGSPSAYSLGSYQLVYANHIQTYGASTSTTVGALNLAGEVSVRTHEDLNSTVTLLPGESANNSSNARYATGNTLHYQVSEVYLGPKLPGLWDSSALIGEAAGDNLLSIDKNSENFNRAASGHMALGFRAIGTATYYQVLHGLDIDPSIGLGWNFMGKAPDTLGFNNTGIDRGGDITFGISGTYLNKWTGGIDYTYYIGPPNRDPVADRDFVSFNVERTF